MDGAANPLNFQIPRGVIRVSSLLLAGKGQSTFQNPFRLIHCSERKDERSPIIVVTSTFLATPPCLSRRAAAAPSTAPPPPRTLTLTRTPFYVASCFPIPKTWCWTERQKCSPSSPSSSTARISWRTSTTRSRATRSPCPPSCWARGRRS